MRHAARWQLMASKRLADQAVRAPSWLGPERAPQALLQLAGNSPALSDKPPARPTPPFQVGWLRPSVRRRMADAWFPLSPADQREALKVAAASTW